MATPILKNIFCLPANTMPVLIMTLAAALLPAPLQAAGPPLTADPAPLRLEVVEQWPGGLVVDLELHGMAAEPVSLMQEGFHRLLVPGAGRLAEAGRPELPTVARYLALPRGADVEVEILDGVEIRIPALRPLPHQPPGTYPGVTPSSPDPAVYGSRTVFPARRAEVEAPRDVRGCPVALLKIYPVRFDPAGQALLYTPRMRVRLLFRNGGRFIDPRHRTPSFDSFFRALLLNADSLGPPASTGQPPPQCEMLIITPALFLDEALRLARWKNRRGIPTLVRTTAETGDTATEIKTWIEQQYQTVWEELSYLLIFGDVGNTDSVPCRYFTDHEDDGIKVGTDLYYGVMDVVAGEQDYFPDLFMGRIPVDTVQQATTVVDKILAYEQAPYTGDSWLDSILIAAQNDPDRFFIETSEAIHDYLAPAGYTCNRQYADGEPSGSTKGVLQAIDDGVFLVTHRGHGQDRNPGDPHTGWVKPEFTEVHVPQLTNGSLLPVMFSVNCRSGWFDGETDGHPDLTRESFCEKLLRHDNGGVVGVIGAARTSYSGYNDELLKGFVDAIWDQFDPEYPTLADVNPLLSSPLYQMGAVLNFGKYWMYDKYIVSGWQEYPDNDLYWPTERRNRIQFEAYHYFGDPSMEIWTGTPADQLVVSHNSQAFIGDTEFTVNVNLDQALVAVSQDGVLIGRAVSSDDQTTVQFAEPLAQPGQLAVCVTRHDQLPYLDGTVEVVPPDGPWVLYQAHQVDDTPAGGNGDGLVSPGETVDIHLALHNFGNITASGVTAGLTSKSGQVEIIKGQAAYPAIAPGETAESLQPFTIRMLPDCPDGELVRFMVSASDGASTWESGFFIEIDGAHVTHYSHQVLDSLPGCGNQNYIADPGERFDLRVSVRNIGLVYASQVSAELSTTHPDVYISVAHCEFPNIASGNVATSNSPHFRVDLDEDTECGEVIPFTLLVSAAEGLTSTGFDLLVGGRELSFADDMEQGPGDWFSEIFGGVTDWEIVLGQPPGNPGHAWFTPGEGVVKDNRLESPSFPVTNGCSVRFRHRVIMEAGFDGCVLEISTDGGDGWADLGSRITYGGYTHQLYDGYKNPLGGRPAWSGTTGPSLTRVEVDLDDFAGRDAILRYRMGCDESGTPDGSGWHIDDLEVEGVACNDWMSPDDTISMEMICTPVSATLPFNVTVQAMVHNQCDRARRVAATLDLKLAGGYYMADLVTGSRILFPGQTVPWGINRVFPGHPMLVGVNTFHFSAYDITEYPYNQPPDYPASGDTAVGLCEVECLIP